MAAPVSNSTSVSLKLLIVPKSGRLLFAETGKDFVDVLFNIMSLPVATVITLLGKQGTMGCTGNVYDSIENLDDSYMMAAVKKDMLLKPVVANYDANVALLLPRPQSSTYTNLYRCNCDSIGMYVTNDPNTSCPSCGCGMRYRPTFVNLKNKPSYLGKGGFVKGAATYIVMDDLVVRPMSTESIIALLNKFNITCYV